MSLPIKARLFVWSDLVFIGVSLLALICAVGAQLTRGNPTIGLAIMWSVAVGCIVITTIMYLKRKKQIRCLRYWAKGMVVAWKESKYAVVDVAFETQVDDLLAKLKSTYPDAQRALNDCVVFFTDPVFVQWSPGTAARKVAGIQDGPVIGVGWHQDLKQSALQHELCHRVMQVFGGDSPEEVAHRMMQQMGIG